MEFCYRFWHAPHSAHSTTGCQQSRKFWASFIASAMWVSECSDGVSYSKFPTRHCYLKKVHHGQNNSFPITANKSVNTQFNCVTANTITIYMLSTDLPQVEANGSNVCVSVQVLIWLVVGIVNFRMDPFAFVSWIWNLLWFPLTLHITTAMNMYNAQNQRKYISVN